MTAGYPGPVHASAVVSLVSTVQLPGVLAYMHDSASTDYVSVPFPCNTPTAFWQGPGFTGVWLSLWTFYNGTWPAHQQNIWGDYSLGFCLWVQPMLYAGWSQQWGLATAVNCLTDPCGWWTGNPLSSINYYPFYETLPLPAGGSNSIHSLVTKMQISIEPIGLGEAKLFKKGVNLVHGVPNIAAAKPCGGCQQATAKLLNKLTLAKSA